MKCELAQELVVGGFTDPQGKRVGLGALLVATTSRTTSSSQARSELALIQNCYSISATKSDKIEIPKAPFTRSVGLPRVRAHWVKPEIVVQVGFIEWTKHNKLRHPRLLAIRNDKDPARL